MIFESHAHYDDDAFDQDREELLGGMQENGIETIVNVCAAVQDIDHTVVLMEKYPFVYGAVGVHPDDVGALFVPLLAPRCLRMVFTSLHRVASCVYVPVGGSSRLYRSNDPL